ncbi:MAG: DUF1664 domain-containing protein [Pyrinomonadaceae bacterium MAG19_C2-C3]|nr:DUF1664 domain-containing protein [Pyrinomonadaceae bacterium MAG19_C2-C3]
MWKDFLSYAKQLLLLTQETQRNREDIKEARQEVKDTRQEITELRRDVKEIRQEFNQLVVIVNNLMYEAERNNDNERHEREKLALQLRNELLSEQLRLPPKGEG